MDKVFFSGLCGVCLYVLSGQFFYFMLFAAAMLLLLTMIERQRWNRFRRRLRQDAQTQLKREDWLAKEAERIRKAGGEILFPTPDGDTFMGLCLRLGPGTTFHCFGEPKEDLNATALKTGCALKFHPWGQEGRPSQSQVDEKLRQDAPKSERRLWQILLHLPGNRYLATGFLLLALSIFLKKAIYWRLLGSLCLLIGAFRRSFRTLTET